MAGTDTMHRQALLDKVNTKYASLIAEEYSQEQAYVKMVSELSYRLLHGFTYEKKPRPFRSNRCAMVPPETDGSTTGSLMNLLDWEVQSNSPVFYYSEFT